MASAEIQSKPDKFQKVACHSRVPDMVERSRRKSTTAGDGSAAELDKAARLRLFDASTVRQRKREANKKTRRPVARGWGREELYTRGGPGSD